MLSRHIRFKFKGSRDYVQGADIFNQMARELISIKGLVGYSRLLLSIHTMIRNHCRLVLLDETDDDLKDRKFCAEMKIVHDGKALTGLLLETSDPVTGHYEFDEALIGDACTTDGNKIAIGAMARLEFTPIEIIVSMTKELHNTIYPDPGGKWIFTRLSLLRYMPPESRSNLSIELEHSFQNRLTKSALYLDNQILGHIYFSLLK